MPTQKTKLLKAEYDEANAYYKGLLNSSEGEELTQNQKAELQSAKKKLDEATYEYSKELGLLHDVHPDAPIGKVVREPRIEPEQNPWIKFTPTMIPQPPTNKVVLVGGYYKNSSKKEPNFYTGQFDGTKWVLNTRIDRDISGEFVVTAWQNINKSPFLS